jgi:hypothetical protein
MATSGQDRIRELTARMLRKKLYVILSTPCCRNTSNT